MRIFVTLITIFLFAGHLHANSVFEISESSLKSALDRDLPSILKLEAAEAQISSVQKQFVDRFDFTLNGVASHLVNNERSLLALDVVSTPIDQQSLGVTRPTINGVDLSAKLFSQQVSNSYVKELSTTGASVGVSIDLHKNFWGRLNKSQLQSIECQVAKMGLEKKIQRKTFFNQLRKIYWSLVANNESMKIAQNLLRSSKKQLADARKRYRSSIADLAEVSKYDSQVASRKVGIITLQYQKERYQQQLKELIPHIANSELVLAPYDLNKALSDVLSCTAAIQMNSKTPLDYTFYDEVINAIDAQYLQAQKEANAYGDWDLNLSSEYKVVGKDLGLSESVDDFQTNGKNGYQVALSLSVPFGGKKSDSREVKKIYNDKKFLAEKRDLLGKMEAQHIQTKRSVELMYEIMKNQKYNSEKLLTALRVAEKKYRQARISANDYISDQNNYLASNIDEINTKLLMITTIIDYLSVFTEFPCGLNKVL